jgi:hypothetical protein
MSRRLKMIRWSIELTSVVWAKNLVKPRISLSEYFLSAETTRSSQNLAIGPFGEGNEKPNADCYSSHCTWPTSQARSLNRENIV